MISIRLFYSLVVLSLVTVPSAQAVTTPAEKVKQPLPGIQRELDLRADIHQQIETAWRESDFKTLDAMGEDFALHHSKTPSGLWKLDIYFDTLTGLAHIEWPKKWAPVKRRDCNCVATDPVHYAEGDKRWAVLDAKLAAWTQRYPQSIVAPLVRIHYLINRAWFYRGSDYADKVAPQAWPRFRHYIGEADNVLKSYESIRYKNPAWYGAAAMIAVVNDWPQADRERLYDDMAAHGQLYTPAFLSAAGFLKPQWNGKSIDIHWLIEKAMYHASEEDGLEFYTRFYWALVSNAQPGQQYANWEPMSDGFDILLKRYPDPLNVAGAAQMACIYEDQSRFEQAIQQLGESERYHGKPLSSVDCDKIYYR